MNNLLAKAASQGYSTLALADNWLRACTRRIILALLMPIPLMAAAVAGFFYYEAHWYKDIFLCAIMALFAFGQVSAFTQMISLWRGARKAHSVLTIVRDEENEPDLKVLQDKLMNNALSCHLRDTMLRWIQLGLQGETDGMERMMEHSALRRDESSARFLKLHITINRTTLKFGFLGTLIGLMMTFEPMKQAMLSLQGSQGEFKFIHDLVQAIDADAYAIVTTLFATGLSIFIELLTIQLLERILGQFEMVNTNLDDWCLIHLQPWIKKRYAAEAIEAQESLLERQHLIAEKMAAVQKSMDDQIRALAASIKETAGQIAALAPVQQAVHAKVNELAEYERQYRSFVRTQLQPVINVAADKEARS